MKEVERLPTWVWAAVEGLGVEREKMPGDENDPVRALWGCLVQDAVRASVPGTPYVVTHSFPQPWAPRAGVLCLRHPAFPSCWLVPKALAGALGLPVAFSLGVCAFPGGALTCLLQHVFKV